MPKYEFFTRDMMPEQHRVSTLPHCETAVNLDSDAKKRASMAVRMTQLAKNKGNQLRTYRVENNYALHEVCDILKCDKKLLSKIERSEGYLKPEHQIRLKPFYGNLVYRSMEL